MNLNNLSIVAMGKPGLGICGLPCCILCFKLVDFSPHGLSFRGCSVFPNVIVILTELLTMPCAKSDKLNKVHLWNVFPACKGT